MTALVTGASGFLGGFLVEALVRHGVKVRAFVRHAASTSSLERLGVELAWGHLHDADAIRRAVRGVDVVIHAAAKVDVAGPWAEHYQITVEGTRLVARAAAEESVSRFVQVSSASVYHPEVIRAPRITERHPAGPSPRYAYYSRCKLAAEHVVRRTFADRPAAWTIARVGYLYGPRNRAMDVYYRRALSSGKVWLIGRADNPIALLYVQDCAEALALLAVCPRVGGCIYNVADDEGITQREFLWAFADGFRLPRPTRHIPYPLAFLGAWANEWSARLTGKPAELNRMMVLLMGLPQNVDTTALRRATGWAPKVNFQEGLRRTFDWYWWRREPS